VVRGVHFSGVADAILVAAYSGFLFFWVWGGCGQLPVMRVLGVVAVVVMFVFLCVGGWSWGFSERLVYDSSFCTA
jgi:hypothetical protein